MPKFRLVTPKRRESSQETNQYSNHRNNLKEDFNQRCGYCDDSDRWRDNYYEIDHFVPRQYLQTIKITEYNNLVYSCRSCNSAKRDKWPTGNEKLHNDGKQGFIDPCNLSYDACFKRDENGLILPTESELSKYMYYGLMLFKRRHAICWSLERLEKAIVETEKYIEQADASLLRRLAEMNRKYRQYRDQLTFE